MATAKQMIRKAQSQLGVKEFPPGSNRQKYGEWFGANAQPWCAMFVSWCFYKVGINTYRHSYTPSFVNQFKEEKRWHTSGPKPGDIVFFDFPDAIYRVQHVGIVEKVNADGSITTIEGNTSQTSDDNGGEVQRRVRRSSIVGYGRPAYDPPFTKKVIGRITLHNRKRVRRVVRKLKELGLKVTVR